MISFRLCCNKGHEFDGWFRSGEDYDEQLAQGVLACPACGSAKVAKGLMTPNVGPKANRAADVPPQKLAAAPTPEAAQALKQMKQLRDRLLEKSDYVGDKFTEEARRMHYEETPQRGIHGEASLEEAKELNDEGIAVMPVPVLPEDRH